MPIWGYKQFQSDLEPDLGIETFGEQGLAKHPNFNLWNPENTEELVANLGSDICHELLERLQGQKRGHVTMA